MKVTNQFKSKIKTYLVKRLGAFEYKHGWLRVPVCPYCHRENKMGVNLSLNRCNCFRCGKHPAPIQLIMDVEKFDTFHEVYKYLNNGDFNELTFTEEKVELAQARLDKAQADYDKAKAEVKAQMTDKMMRLQQNLSVKEANAAVAREKADVARALLQEAEVKVEKARVAFEDLKAEEIVDID